MTGTLSSLGRRALRTLGSALPRAEGGVTVLAYHLVGAGTDSPVDLPLERFRRQLDELAASGRVISLERALELLRGAAAAERHRVVLTFDDAFRNFYEVAWPLLRERRLPCTIYVPCGFIDGSSPSPLAGAETLPPMTWDQLCEVAASPLAALGSHTLTHPDLRRLEADACRTELFESRRRIEQRAAVEVTSFCYPRALWSPAVVRRVAELYDSAVAAGGRRNRRARFRPHLISRHPVRRDMPADLETVSARAVWLEEWAAAHARRWAW